MRINGLYIVLRCKLHYKKLINDTNMHLARKQEYRRVIYEQKAYLSESSILSMGESTFYFSLNIHSALPPTFNHQKSVDATYYLHVLMSMPKRLRTCRLISTKVFILPKIHVDNEAVWLLEKSKQRLYIDNDEHIDLSTTHDTNEYIEDVKSISVSIYHTDANLKCSVTLPDHSFGVRKVIPFTCLIQKLIQDLTNYENDMEEYQVEISLIQCTTVDRNLYRNTIDKQAYKFKYFESADQNIEYKDSFALSKATSPPSYTNEEYGVSISYMISCSLKSCADKSANKQVTTKAFKKCVHMPIFIFNSEVAWAHPRK
ncbi:hypothetical protein GJ496_011313 [Pomphorhynchus laevis]|nr:hypothetical protein GJ496_011313 [Pomphorhynchus laevis]